MTDQELTVGMPAPDFTLKDQDENSVKLSSLKGKKAVVLIFYPGDMTPGCTMQLCAIRDDWQKFKEANIEVYGINHAEAVSHEKFIKKYSFPFPLLIDANKKVSALYGAVRPLFKAMIIKRSVVGIDKGGIIRYLKRGLPRNAEILKAMTK
ncbi:MAG: peroxiredoxin [bacterium]|nr:peroxiredoxin [bacterium]